MKKMVGSMSRYTVVVPIELHRQFKMHCAAEGLLMSEAIRALLAQACAGDSTASSKLAAKPVAAEAA
jgi:hypothetical protein